MSRFLVSVKLAPCSQTPFDAVRHAGDVVESDPHGNAVTWRESYAPGSLLLSREGATVELGHDVAPPIGRVVTVAASGGYWYADLEVESDDDEVTSRLRPGVGVSLGARLLATDTDFGLYLRRHRDCELEHVAICREGERPQFPDAKIVTVREMKSSAPTKPKPAPSGVDWRTVLPREWADGVDVSVLSADPPQSISDNQLGLAWRWTGEKFVAAAYGRSRLAA